MHIDTKSDREEILLKILMENQYANIDDILSHKWFIFSLSDETIWLRCSECNFYYSASVFKNGSIIRFFINDTNAKETMQIMNCEACKMHDAIG